MIFLFDLDGTIIDSQVGIINSFVYAFEKEGESVPNIDVKSLIGPPLLETMVDLGYSESEAIHLINLFREYYEVKGKFESCLYDGIKELLKEISGSYRIAIATSKPESQAVELLKYNGIYDYFEFVGGASMDHKRSLKHDVIEHSLANLNVVNRENIYMIGDREADISGAIKSNIKSIGVLWGYGDYSELKSAGADYICESTLDLKNKILML